MRLDQRLQLKAHEVAGRAFGGPSRLDPEMDQPMSAPETAHIDSLTIDCADPERLAGFWCALLGYERKRNFTASYRIGPSEDDHGPTLVLTPQDPGRKTGKNRLHLDLRPQDRDAFVARALCLGASRVAWAAEIEKWTVLADPEGNEFCVLQSAKDYVAFVAQRDAEQEFRVESNEEPHD
ncbi:VOC family protein [Flexivirga caeni]|uniref:VOC family protein n=1 Tax=Flexivirga caeni TaxID=2294115 RepID=UPI001FE7B734|nr:VOC family protein [Flexivirga caeni]